MYPPHLVLIQKTQVWKSITADEKGEKKEYKKNED